MRKILGSRVVHPTNGRTRRARAHPAARPRLKFARQPGARNSADLAEISLLKHQSVRQHDTGSLCKSRMWAFHKFSLTYPTFTAPSAYSLLPHPTITTYLFPKRLHKKKNMAPRPTSEENGFSWVREGTKEEGMKRVRAEVVSCLHRFVFHFTVICITYNITFSRELTGPRVFVNISYRKLRLQGELTVGVCEVL